MSALRMAAPPAPRARHRRATSAGVHVADPIVAGLVVIMLAAVCLAIMILIETIGSTTSPAGPRTTFVVPATYGAPGPTGGPHA
jgi:hypothetical protein